ncbi:conserved hypothetical protein [Seinonella peptonophila]|uniref:Purine nucleoside phosphorylase n=1 Tax=Seinonella peptonophila TaxID=112248 RepID=A0A1M4UYW7_9BACL|nr:peptidoglycan editing factor PgeF [Seinonella peptonophila]SHE61859.1 conserved hypothetical protein [Seinonella peptonophila]
MEPFVYQHMSKVPYFSLEHWKWEFPNVVAGFSARLPHEDRNDRNYALHIGQDQSQVLQNRRKLVEQLGFSLESWTCGTQIHETQIAVVTASDRGKGATEQETAFSNTDGLITQERQLFLASFYADCVPLFVYCPDTGFIGVAHAGWRGTVAQMASRLVEKLTAQGSSTHNLRIAIGPSIGGCCYIVDDHVMKPIRQLFPMAESQKEFVKQVDEGLYQLDLKKLNQQIFLREGIRPEHLIVSKWCTSCDQQYFYSYRRDRGDTGRMVAWIAKK